MRHKITTAVFAQGWLGGQIESMVASASQIKEGDDQTPAVIASQIAEQWKIVDEAMDDLIKENGELKRKLSIVESAFS
jgi:hypothetical protein